MPLSPSFAEELGVWKAEHVFPEKTVKKSFPTKEKDSSILQKGERLLTPKEKKQRILLTVIMSVVISVIGAMNAKTTQELIKDSGSLDPLEWYASRIYPEEMLKLAILHILLLASIPLTLSTHKKIMEVIKGTQKVIPWNERWG